MAIQGCREVLLVRARAVHQALNVSTLKTAKQNLLNLDEHTLTRLAPVYTCVVKKAGAVRASIRFLFLLLVYVYCWFMSMFV